MDGEWKVKLRWVKSVLFALVFAWLAAGTALAEDLLKTQIEALLNLGTEIQVEKYQNGDDIIALWTEGAESGKRMVQNWGLIYLVKGNVVDSWFYEGPHTNMFQRFLGSFQQITTDAHKELVLIGYGGNVSGEARIFAFNLADQRLKLIFEEQSAIQPGILEKAGERQAAGMLQDLNHDRVMEIVTYRELKGTVGTALYWPDLYAWNGTTVTCVNKKYPDYFLSIMKELERAAQAEEILPTGNYPVFYECIAKVYDIRNQPKEAAAAREQMLLPPLELGKRVGEFLHRQGYQIYRTFRIDLDGVAPLDAVFWARTPDGKQNQIWCMTQNRQTVGEAEVVPVPATFFESGGDVTFTVRKGQIWAFRKPTLAKPGFGVLFRLENGMNPKLTLLGTEERELLVGGKVVRKVTGETYRDPELAAVTAVVSSTSVITAVKAQGTVAIDGRFMENDWARAAVLSVSQEARVVWGFEDWNHTKDLSYVLRTMYRGSSLYFSVKVTDDIRVYATKVGVRAGWLSDHIELNFVVQGVFHRYGIFILPTEALAFEWVGEEWKAPAYPVRAQWMPGPDGYWVEFEINGLPLNMTAFPMTVSVFDKDTADGFNPYHDTVMATSDFKADDPETLGILQLD